MLFKDISRIRLLSQQIEATEFTKPKEIVSWMGAMQAQDYNMAKWAIGSRLKSSTDALIQDAIDEGQILRTHVLRPTWHLVAAEDIYWMLELTVPQMNILLRSRYKQLELTKKTLIKSNSIIEKALSGGRHLTREELMAQLQKAKIVTSDLRASHIMHQAELDGIVCNGIMRGKNRTYALLEERVPKTKPLKRDEALARLTERYFKSHGPATTDDFIWWSGLNITDGKNAVEMIKEKLFSETIKSKTYWLYNTVSAPEKFTSSSHMLPAFDEFIISYKDRTAMLDLEHHRKAFSNNGIFYPVIVMNGKVIGLWKRNIKKDLVIIQAELFMKMSKSAMDSIEKRFNQFGKFLEKKAEVHFNKL